jgi:hypothetical protein
MAGRASLTISITGIPEAMAELRHGLADLLREEAGAEADPRVARRLREVAATFEVGLSRVDRADQRRRRRE